MDLNELYRRLAIGELTNLALAEGGVIAEDKKSAIVLHANSALKRLYIRFLLKEDTVIIEQQTNDRTSYPLSSKYAQSNTDPSNTLPKYINDVGKPFTDDVIKVMAVYDGNGLKLPLNDPNCYNSVYTPQPAVIQVPHPNEGMALGVLYQASHPVLSEGNPTQVLELPEFLSGALTAFVAYKVFTQMNTQENTVKAGEHLKTYESICIEAVEQDLITTGEYSGGVRFVKNGWV